MVGSARWTGVPRFYFHLINDIDVPDNEGKVLADLAAAQHHAIQQARALMAAMIAEKGRLAFNHRIDIEDEAHVLVGSTSFRDAVTIED